ncbi:threonine/serine ThrE exporter family protein [Streptomyces sp. NBC_00525]|uniref:threonine/serine ThrE exporter family protein n=1 Tax=Streptomyces sp. NBC_00525 TaxID=2903660 RepID=UPI002E812D7B|nr:threonine/serine exporter family protein [Streptomyces sp. NBC_00525]WUC97395.1 threonine/serine exporter family protein [Streptomyces sp. NBC_00525]
MSEGPDADADTDRDGGHEAVVGFLDGLTRLLLGTSGEGAEQIERSVVSAARGLGGTASVAVLPDAATLAVRSHGRDSVVVVRAFPEVFRMDQVVALKPLVDEVAAGRLDALRAGRRLDAIARAAPPYPWWAKLVGIVLFSVGFAPLMQPTWYEIGSTAVLAAVAGGLAVAADRLPRLAKVLPLVVAVTVSLITLEVFARTPAHGGPVLLMLPALFFFVPGDYLSAAAAELAAGYLTTGAIRLVYAVALLVQLYVGVILGLVVTGRPRQDLFDVAAGSDLPRWVLFASWIVFTAGALLAFAVPARLLGMLLALVYLTVGVQTGFTALLGDVGGTFVAAVVLGAATTWLARRPGRPPRLVLVLPGFFTLTVGSLGMRGLTALAGGYAIEGFRDLTELITIVMAIGAGLLLGAVAAQRPGDG